MNAREFIAMILQLIHTLFTSMSRVFNQYTSKTITLNNKIFTIQKQLGEGGFSFVYLVKSTSTLSTQYAIKRIRIALPEHEQRLDSEINAHSLVQSSPYVIQLIDHQKVMHGQRCSEGLLLLPYYQLGTLQHLINTKQNISLKRILEISMDVCSGLLAFQ